MNTIGDGAFKNCTELYTITLPEKVKNMLGGIFTGCRKLTDIFVLNPTPPEILSVTFSDATFEGGRLFTPNGNRTTYWLLPFWGKFNIISEEKDYTPAEFEYNSAKFQITSFKDNNVELLRIAEDYNQPEFVISTKFNYDNKEYKVTGVAKRAFKDSNVESVALNCYYLDYISSWAFTGCNNLKALYLSPDKTIPEVYENSFDANHYENVKLHIGSYIAYFKDHLVWRKFESIDALSWGESGITDIVAEDITEYPIQVFDLKGRYMGSSTDGLLNGIYIVRQGLVSKKILVVR